MTNAVATTNGAAMIPYQAPGSSQAFEPADLGQAMQLAATLYKGGLLPSSFRSPEAVVTAIILGRELGLTAMQSIRGIHVIEGKPTLSADMMVAVVRRSPVCRYFRLVESTDESATYETHREGEPDPVRMSYGKKEAIAAGKWGKGTWAAHPAPMCRARASSALARAVYQDLVMGVYDPDEIEPQAPAIRATVVEQDRTVDSGTGEVTEGEIVEATTPAASKSESRLAHDALMARFTELAKLVPEANGEDCLAGRKAWLKGLDVSSVTNLTAPQKRQVLATLENEAGRYQGLVLAARDARWAKEAAAKEQAEADDIPPFEPIPAEVADAGA